MADSTPAKKASSSSSDESKKDDRTPAQKRLDELAAQAESGSK